MVPIGALCYGSLFIFHDHLKQAIVNHSQWTPQENVPPPIFDIYVSEFIASGKKTKMLFVSSEHSRQEEVIHLLKTLYDGAKKIYPNGSMMLFILHSMFSNASSDFKNKILLNHNRFIGDESLFSIGSLKDLDSLIKLKNGKSAMLLMILKSIPASEGMSHPQLFQNVEPNHGTTVTIITYQAQDHTYVIACQATLENELRQIIEPGEGKIFLNDSEGFSSKILLKNLTTMITHILTAS